MIRPTHVSVTVLAAALLAAACAPGEPTGPTQPTAAEAKSGKPGGGGTTSPVGHPLGTAFGSRAYAVSASWAVGRDASGAVAWDAGGQAVPLPTDASATFPTAFGINAAGTIVGTAGSAAVVWQPSGPGSWATAVALPTPPGLWTASTAFGINAEGRIAGTGTRGDNLRFALRWTPAGGGYTVEVVPAAGADYEFVGHAIANGTGWVTGWVRRSVAGAVVKDAFVWTAAGSFRLLGRLNGASSEARGINASGRIAGWSASAPRGGDSSPVTWTCTETGCAGPVTLPAFYRNLNLAFSINDAGDIVGTSGLDAILYSHCGTTVVLKPPAGWHQSYGWAVSGDGSAAAGYSFLDGNASMQATRWTLPAGCR